MGKSLSNHCLGHCVIYLEAPLTMLSCMCACVSCVCMCLMCAGISCVCMCLVSVRRVRANVFTSYTDAYVQKIKNPPILPLALYPASPSFPSRFLFLFLSISLFIFLSVLSHFLSFSLSMFLLYCPPALLFLPPLSFQSSECPAPADVFILRTSSSRGRLYPADADK